LYTLAYNLPYWRPSAISLLVGVVIGALYLFATVFDE
jgi:uncharacterized membrane-anchored protein YhcB (DUF1043 family)